ncbi:DUF4150 domain-containing protein [Nannocystis poenicansa]|uniref:DUF4150 domain-containing protein n=2 Tax=Nannocystis punicea TaxID=2995304 RepID=A0ABY7GVY0_9BACT|nr:DUF4150 domain-containing protein [Nannocystis poenicansa]
MPSVFANGRSIIHSGDGLKHVAAPPDVCKTPTPGGPVPLPYVNVAFDSDLAAGTKQVKIEGSPVAHSRSHLSTSTGDEPGTAGGGIISSKTKGKMKWGTSSADVRVEGKGVARFMDITQHNGNSYNDAFQAFGGSGFAYADDFRGRCEICGKGPHRHRVLATPSSMTLCKDIITALHKDPGAQKKRFMVGVMICGRCGMSFGSMSGKTSTLFTSVASSIVDQVVGGGAATAQDFINSNKTKFADDVKRARGVNTAWQAMETAARNSGPNSGYNHPGACAGAKLIARAGHVPKEMTEMMFSPSGWEQRYRVMWTTWRSTTAKVLFTTGETVPSCHTCQRLLYLANCPERTCP